MAHHRFQPLKIYSNSNIFGPPRPSSAAPVPRNRPPRTAGFEIGGPTTPKGRSLETTGESHARGQWSPSPSVTRELIAMRYGPGRRPLIDASKNVKFAPLRCEWRDDPQQKRVRLQQEPHKPTALALPLSRAHAWAPRDEPVRRSSSGKLRIAFPPGIASSKRLSARRPQHGSKPAVVDDTAVLNAQATAGLLMLKWDPSSGVPGVSPAPSAPETPSTPNRDGVHDDGPSASAHHSPVAYHTRIS
jgi:hypothetical protein